MGARWSFAGRSSAARSIMRDPLLEAAGQVDLAAAVAKVALELAEDRRRRVAREGVAQRRVEALDRLDQPQARDLVEVLGRLGAAGVAVGEAAGERHEAVDELFADRGAPLTVVALEQLLLVGQLLVGAGAASIPVLIQRQYEGEPPIRPLRRPELTSA